MTGPPIPAPRNAVHGQPQRLVKHPAAQREQLPGFLDDSQAAAVIDHGRAQHTKGRQDGADHLTAQLRHLIGAAPAPAPTRREVEELSRRLDRLEEAQPRRGRPL